MMNWLLRRAGPSGFSFSSTAEEVTHGIDASHLTAIVTGASSGIGSETVRVLALRGAYVIMAVRNVASGIALKEKIIQETGNAKVDVLELDLSSLFSVQKFASNFRSLNLPLNILINNAGAMPLIYQLSQDGIELQFATNYLGHFFLTNLLLDIMKETSQNTGIEGRIVNVSSDAHKFCYPSGIQFDRINEKECYSYFFTYCQTKLANVLHANELSRRFKEEGSNLTANSVHPGTIPTDLARHNKVSQFILKILKSALKDVPQGAATQCFVAMHPNMKGVSGKYFYDSNESPPSSSANDIELAARLWTFSENIISSHLSENKIT